jgi:hypothetical protein
MIDGALYTIWRDTSMLVPRGGNAPKQGVGSHHGTAMRLEAGIIP